MKAKMEKIYAYVNSNFDVNYITSLMEDIKTAAGFIAFSILVALFLGMVWMVVMKMCAAVITWLTIILVQLLIVALTFLLYSMGTARQTEIENYPADVEKPINYTLYVSYGFMVICGIMFCAIICMYNKIRIVIAIMETSADFVTEVCTVMLVPPIMMILTMIWSLVWIFLAVYVYSNG